MEDQDCQFLEGLTKRGVPLGVRGEIPLVPAVYDRKEKGEQESLGSLGRNTGLTIARQ